jgi:hypothetical protein
MARPREDLIIAFNQNMKFETYKLVPINLIWDYAPPGWTVQTRGDLFLAVYRADISTVDLNDLERAIRTDGLRDGRGFEIVWSTRWEANRWAWFKAAMYARERVRVC